MRILLFANIGTAPNRFYHIGDEAMFLETCRWYKKHFRDCDITLLTSSPNHHHLKINEVVNPIQFPTVTRKYFFLFSLKTLLYKFFRIKLLSPGESQLINLIKRQDRIHFSGGGNLTSIYRDWLYYSLMIMTTGLIYSKQIYLTSQTIGPFTKADKIIFKVIANRAKVIGVRGHADSLIKTGITKPKIINMLDAAYALPTLTNKKLPSKEVFRIGLSFHEWSNNNSIYILIIQALNNISKTIPIEVLLLPHVLVDNIDEWDMGLMRRLLNNQKNSFKVISPPIEDLLSAAPEPAYYLKKLTSSVDLLLSSRYHGVIFALSQNIPVLTLSPDSYYTDKNTNALKIYYPHNFKEYIFPQVAGTVSKIQKFLRNHISRNEARKYELKSINNKILKNYDLFSNNLGQQVLS